MDADENRINYVGLLAFAYSISAFSKKSELLLMKIVGCLRDAVNFGFTRVRARTHTRSDVIVSQLMA